MAFLLSPKTDAGGTYALHTDGVVSVNGGAPREYPSDDYGSVKPGDFITAEKALSGAYWDTLDPEIGSSPLKEFNTSDSYTVEKVAGAVLLDIYANAS